MLRLIARCCRYSHAQPALLFHATHDDVEKNICCMGFCREFHGAFKWGQRNYWQRGLLQHATNVGHMMFAALVHTPCSQHRYVSQSASNGLCMYITEYQSNRVNVRAAGEVCFLARWVDQLAQTAPYKIGGRAFLRACVAPSVNT